MGISKTIDYLVFLKSSVVFFLSVYLKASKHWNSSSICYKRNCLQRDQRKRRVERTFNFYHQTILSRRLRKGWQRLMGPGRRGEAIAVLLAHWKLIYQSMYQVTRRLLWQIQVTGMSFLCRASGAKPLWRVDEFRRRKGSWEECRCAFISKEESFCCFRTSRLCCFHGAGTVLTAGWQDGGMD